MTRALLLAQSLALALVMTWPAPRDLGAAAIGTPGGDVAKHIWNLWWARAEWRQGSPGLPTTLVNWPAGMQLYPIEPLNGLVSVLVGLEPVLLSNVMALTSLLLTGLCAGWLGELVTGTRRGALTTSALIQGCAFSAFTLHVGVGELRQMWWIPLGLGCLVRAQETLSPRWFAALALTLASATLSCFYHGLFLATAVSLHALASLRKDRRLLLGYAAAATLGLLIVLPIIHTFSGAYGPISADRGGFWSWMTAPFAIDPLPAASLDLPDLLRPRNADRNGAERLAYAYTGGRYLGWLGLGLAVLGLASGTRRARPWVVMALAAIVLAMGTRIWWFGAMVPLPITLPMLWINRALAWFAEPLNFPVRFLSVTMVAVAVLAGLAVSRWRAAAGLVPLALVDIARHDLTPWPRDMTELPFGFTVGAPTGAVADLSLMIEGDGRKPSFYTNEGALIASWITPELRARSIAAQVTLDRPFQTVPIERQEMWALDGLLWTAALPLSEALVHETVSADDLRGSIQLLRDRGFASVILTRPCGGVGDAPATRVLDEVVGIHISGGCFDLWALPEIPSTAAERAGWTEAQARRFAALPLPSLLATTPGSTK